MKPTLKTTKILISAVVAGLFFAAGLCANSTDDEKSAQILKNAGISEADLDDEDDIPDANGATANGTIAAERDVRYTETQYALIRGYFDHKLSELAALTEAFNAAERECEVLFAENDYALNVAKARNRYFYGMVLMESFDLTNLEKMDLSDTSETEDVNKKAGEYYDTAIEYATKALKARKGSDAYSILAHSISANCTAKTTGYVLSNGLKVRSNAKKALKYDSSNGTAWFLISAQDIYAPAPFAKVSKGRKAMERYLTNPRIRLEEFDKFNICSAIGYAYQRQKKYSEAKKWYAKCQKIFPQNTSIKNLLSKIK